MKVRDTSRGRMYAVSSEIGCTVINGDMAVDVPAGGQSVILALDKKLIIDGDDAAKFVEVRWGTNSAIGSRPAPSWMSDVVDGIVSIVGADKFDINYIPGGNKLYLQFSLEVTAEQIDEVKSLLERVLPKDLVLEMEWENGLPVMSEYKPLEYVDCVKSFTHDSIVTTNAPDIQLDMMYVYKSNDYSYNSIAFSARVDSYYGNSLWNCFVPSYSTRGLRLVNNAGDRDDFPINTSNNAPNRIISRYEGKVPDVANKRVQYHIHDCGYSVDGTFYLFEPSEIINNIYWGKMMFGTLVTKNGNFVRIYRMSVRQSGEMTADLVPCMRLEDRCPGFWCNVYKKFYEQSPAMTLELDEEFNGVEYFEPPTEEELQIEEIENA